MNRATLPLTVLILLLSFPTTATAQFRTTAEVVSNGDGDTFTVKGNGEQFTVRLSCIDAPESTQRGGQASEDRLKQLLPQGTNVELRTIERDRYGRTIAEAYKNGASVNFNWFRKDKQWFKTNIWTLVSHKNKSIWILKLGRKAGKLAFGLSKIPSCHGTIAKANEVAVPPNLLSLPTPQVRKLVTCQVA